MASELSIKRAKASAEGKLLKMKGVVGVGVGRKITKGEKTQEMCIRVYVEKKLPKARVAKKDMVPAEIDGYKTDVVERKFVLHERRVKLADMRPQVDAGTYDPLTGGISIGPCRNIDGFVFVGTLGCVVRDRATGDPMLLSNFHVMAVDNSWSAGDTMAQPALAFDGGSCPADVVGELQRAVLGGEVDCAVSSITARGHNCRITEIGAIRGTADAVEDEPVRKRGRTTELTHGFVDDIDLTVTVPYDGIGNVTLVHQIGIEVDASKSAEFGMSGDSGSVVVNADNEVIGLYFAGTDDGSYGVANPIQSVLDALNVDMCTGDLRTDPVIDRITDPWNDFSTPWIDVITTPWLDEWTISWLDRQDTLPWADLGVTPNKRIDDVKNVTYDTMWEHILEDPGFIDPWIRQPDRPRDPTGGLPFAGAAPQAQAGPQAGQFTDPWIDRWTLPWFDRGGTYPWADQVFTFNKRLDDVKSGAYDTMWEHVMGPGPGFGDPVAGAPGPGGPGRPGRVPFAVATPHHYQGWQNVESQAPGAGGPSGALAAQIEMAEAHLERLREELRRAQGAARLVGSRPTGGAPPASLRSSGGRGKT